MVYSNITFPSITNRPFFYTNFVSTIDGKVQVKTSQQTAYWPIGSKTDYQTLIQLRSYADVLIYGKNSALSFNHGQNFAKEEFKEQRRKNNRNPNLLYFIICRTLTKDDLLVLMSPHDANTFFVMPENAQVDKEIEEKFKIVRIGNEAVDIQKLALWLQEQNYKHILVEGGPTLLGEFLEEDLMDEVFLTISPKIFGNETGKTLSLVEGRLFPPDKIKNFELLLVKQVENEVFLRYRKIDK